MLSVGSLFSGIGGFDLGLERTGGFYTAWFCEQDPFCRAVLEQHWPGRYIAPDITELRKADVARVDVLCGGFPCQDLSYAGLGAGIEGARSGLWSEYARLIGELRPSYVVVENVSALLARGLGVVLGDLATLGYDAEWDCIPASALGAPHRRDRIWLVAYPARDLQAWAAATGTQRQRTRAGGQPARAVGNADGERLEGRRLTGLPVHADDGGRGLPPGASGAGQREDVADAGSQRLDGWRDRSAAAEGSGAHGAVDRRGSGWGAEGWWATEPDVGRVAHGVPTRVDRLRSLGNALVPQIAEWIGHRILDYEAGRLADVA